MTTSSFPPIPALPDPVAAAKWAGQIRAILPLIGGILSGVGIALPAFTDAQLNAWIYAGMVLAGFMPYIWSAITSSRSKDADRAVLVASAVASVQNGTPVVITVTPPGEPNDMAHISATEQAAAPLVPSGEPRPAPLAAV